MSAPGLHSPDYSTLIIGVEPDTPFTEIERYLEAQGLSLVRSWPKFGLIEAKAVTPVGAAATDSAQIATTTSLSAVAQSPFVRHVTFDERVYAATRLLSSPSDSTTLEPPMQEPAPNDPLLNQQWAFGIVNAVNAWNIEQGNEEVVVAVIDSGYDAEHPDFDPARIWTNAAEHDGITGQDDDDNGYVDDIKGWDWVEEDNIPNDAYGHGTHITGIIAATTNNAIGVTGLGRNLRIMPLRVLDARGGGFISDLVDALYYAVEKQVDIANMSLVIRSDTPAVRDAIRAAYEAGVLIAAAAGNDGGAVQWPAAYSEALAVAATTSSDTRASYSARGPEVAVAAPGSDILSTYYTNTPAAGESPHTYSRVSGTSMATAHVSALAGLLLSLRPDLSTQSIQEMIQTTAVDVNAATAPGRDNDLGHGRIDFYEALLAASTDVHTGIDGTATKYANVGQTIDIGIRVFVEAGQDEHLEQLPVTGAVVHYVVLDADTEESQSQNSESPTASAVQRIISNQSGIAPFKFQVTDPYGEYIVRTQIGRSHHDLPLNILPPPGDLKLNVADNRLQVGEGETTYIIEVTNQDGDGAPLAVPVHLTTTLGAFENSEKSIDLIVQNGVYTGAFTAGTVSGVANIEASIDILTAQASIELIPGPVAKITGPTDLPSLISDASAHSYPLEFTVTDAYDNPAPDGTAIQVFSSAGSLSPDLLETQDGRATTTLTVVAPINTPVVIRATVLGTSVETRFELPALGPTLWLPLLIAGQ